jgi:hypothetical protein
MEQFSERFRMNEGPRLSRSQFSWFRLANYRDAAEMPLAGWLASLSVRYDAFVRIEDTYVSLADSAVSALLADPLAFPIDLEKERLNSWGDERDEYEVIRDLSIVDAHQLVHETRSPWRDEILGELEALDAWIAASNRSRRGPELVAASRSYRSLQDRGLELDELPIWVDLSADDDLIIERFRSWLAGVRNEHGSVEDQRAWSVNGRFTWTEFGVLPYIDLVIFCNRVAKGRATQALIGSLLFPNEVDVDLTERVRKVVHPMATRLMSARFLSALERRVHQPERV